MSSTPIAGWRAILGATLLLPGPARAMGQWTFVASTGVDNPSCSIAAPCKGFAAAIAAKSANGEI